MSPKTALPNLVSPLLSNVKLPTLHLLGLPHTVTTDEYSHCAFTGKVKRFAPMLRSVGYKVIHYGVDGADSGADEQVDILSASEWEELKTKTRKDGNLPEPTQKSFVGDLANVGNVLYQTFNQRAGIALRDRMTDRDLICLPFGHAHQQALATLNAIDGRPSYEQVETGIGYPTTFTRHLIFESYAWMHHHLGRRDPNIRMMGVDYNWVIPNYFDVSQWDFNPTPDKNMVIYFGRIYDGKGLNEITECAKRRQDLRFVLCGQGDPTTWTRQSKNIEYVAPLHGKARSDLIGQAMCCMMPTRYIEPFGGVTIEANLCGVPVIGTACGSFTETVIHGKTGYQCRTLGDMLAALERVEAGVLSREDCRAHGEQYDMFKIASKYDAAFRQIHNLWGEGWYAFDSRIGPIKKATVPVVLAPDIPAVFESLELKKFLGASGPANNEGKDLAQNIGAQESPGASADTEPAPAE